MARTKNKHDASSQIFGLVERNLPVQDTNEGTQPITGIEFSLWVIGITGALFLLRFAFLLLF